MAFDPSKVSYTQDMVAAAAAGQTLADGTYKFVVDSCKMQEDKNMNIVAVLRLSPLDPEDGVTRKKPLMWHRVYLPLMNGDVAPPDRANWQSEQLFRAVAPDDHPYPPKKNGDSWEYNGEEIDPTDVEDKRLEAADFIAQTAQKWCTENPDLFKDEIFYATVKTTVSEKDGNSYTNLVGICPELPPGSSLTPLSAFKGKSKAKAATSTEKTKTNGKAKNARR